MSDNTSTAPSAAPAASPAAAPAAAASNPAESGIKAAINEAQPAQSADENITAEEEAELASESAESEKPAAKPQLTKIKVDGQEVELTDDEIKKYASLGKAAQKRMQEAATVRKEHEKLQKDVSTFLEMLQKDPGKVLSDIGVDPKKFSEDYINQLLSEEAKSPEQKEKEELLKKLEMAEKRNKEIDEQAKKAKEEKMSNEIAAKIEKDIAEAIDSQNLPKSPYMVRKVADLMMLATMQGINLEAKDVIPLARKQFTEEFKSLTSVIPEEVLEEILGTDKVAALRRRYLKKLKTMPTTPKDVKPTGNETASKGDKDKKPTQKAKDFFKNIGSY